MARGGIRGYSALVAAVLLASGATAGCGSNATPTPGHAGSPQASPAGSPSIGTAASGTPVPSAPVPSGPSAEPTPWWPQPDVTTCGRVAFYRIGGAVSGIGDCAGNLLDPPETATLRVGQTLDLVLSGDANAAGAIVPVVPMPSSSNTAVLSLVSTGSDGRTAAYRANAPGSAVLVTPGAPCWSEKTAAQSFGPCAMLALTVVP